MTLSKEQSEKIGQALLQFAETEFSKDGNEFLDISLKLKKFDFFTPIENLKIDIIKTMLDFYHKYPTLHDIFIHHGGYQKWSISISQLAWDSVEKIKEMEEYKNSHVNIHAFCGNYLNGKRHLDMIPLKDGSFTSYDKINAEIKEAFEKLNLNSAMGEQLHNELKTEKNDYYIRISSRNWYGWKEINLENHIKEFFGQTMLSKLNFFELDNKVEKKENKSHTKKLKV